MATELGTTSTAPVTRPLVDVADLSDSCANEPVPDAGELTVLVGDRIHGISMDGSTRCLIGGVLLVNPQPTDPIPLEWAPTGDGLRIERAVVPTGLSSLAAVTLVTLDPAVDYEWTTPTGERIVEVFGDQVVKVTWDRRDPIDLTFLAETEQVAYHPAGTHLIASGVDEVGASGLWLSDNLGQNETLIAFDQAAFISSPVWMWTGEPVFAARHGDLGLSHVHRVDVTNDEALEGPVLVESAETIDRIIPSPFDPMLIAYRTGASTATCDPLAHTAVVGVDLPAPLSEIASEPIGWLPGERLMVLTHPAGCDNPGDVWVFTSGFCPGSEYGASPIIAGVGGAAVRVARPQPPPSPDVADVPDAAPA